MAYRWESGGHYPYCHKASIFCKANTIINHTSELLKITWVKAEDNHGSGTKYADIEAVTTKHTELNETQFPIDVHNPLCADAFRAGTQL